LTDPVSTSRPSSVPADDPQRHLTVARPDADESLPHLGHVPANAPHGFRNASGQAARLLCMCTPPGQEEFFMAVGVPVTSRTEPPPALDAESQAAFIAKSKALAPEYRTELLLP